MRSEKAIGVAGSFPDRPAYRTKTKIPRDQYKSCGIHHHLFGCVLITAHPSVGLNAKASCDLSIDHIIGTAFFRLYVQINCFEVCRLVAKIIFPYIFCNFNQIVIGIGLSVKLQMYNSLCLCFFYRSFFSRCLFNESFFFLNFFFLFHLLLPVLLPQRPLLLLLSLSLPYVCSSLLHISGNHETSMILSIIASLTNLFIIISLTQNTCCVNFSATVSSPGCL